LVKIEIAFAEQRFVIEYFGDRFNIFKIAGFFMPTIKPVRFLLPNGNKGALADFDILLQVCRHFISEDSI